MAWVIIVGLVILAAYIIQKFVHFSHWNSKFWTLTIIFILGFLALTFLGIAQANSISLSTAKGFFSATKFYFSWLVHVFGNIKAITGNVAKMDWIINSTG